MKEDMSSFYFSMLFSADGKLKYAETLKCHAQINNKDVTLMLRFAKSLPLARQLPDIGIGPACFLFMFF